MTLAHEKPQVALFLDKVPYHRFRSIVSFCSSHPSLVDHRCLIFDAGRVLKSSNFNHPIWVCLPMPLQLIRPNCCTMQCIPLPTLGCHGKAACRIKWKSKRKGRAISARGSDKVSRPPPRKAIGAAGCRNCTVASSFVLDLKRCKSRMWSAQPVPYIKSPQLPVVRMLCFVLFCLI